MAMLDIPTHPVVSQRPEAEADRLSRIRREEAIIARAEADIDAGLGIDDDDLEWWLDALTRDENAPLPLPRSTPPAR
jgi:hypothetical protein